MTLSKEEAIKYFKQENEKCLDYFTNSSQKILFDELKQRYDDYDTAPVYRDDIGYFIRFLKSKQYAQLFRIINEEEECLLDMNTLAKTDKPLVFAFHSISDCHNYLAYGYNTTGDDNYTLVIYDINQREIIKTIENISSSFCWFGKSFFFTRNDSLFRPYQVWKASLDKDENLIFEEKDSKPLLYLERSSDLSEIFIYSVTKTSSQVYSLKDSSPQLLHKREENREEYFEVNNGEYYRLSNYYSKNFSVLKNDKEIITDSKGKIVDMLMLKDYLVLLEQYEVTHIRIIDLKSFESRYLHISDHNYSLSSCFVPDFSKKSLHIAFESLSNPKKTYNYSIEMNEWKLLKEDFVENYDSKYYREEYFYVSGVPVSVCYPKQTHTIVLYGYGAYGHSEEPDFSKNRISLYQRGIGFAIAHVRGGSELGEEWYHDGKFLNKKNTFHDYILVAEHFKKKGFKVVAFGGSAGGLTVGASLNIKPEVFDAAIAGVPFVDVLTTMLDETIPLTIEEFEEWGNPKDSKYYKYIKSYSPVDNVCNQWYPPLFIFTGINDSRVGYWEPLKWHEKLSSITSSTLLLYCDLEAGHAGQTARDNVIYEISKIYAFILKELL